VVDHPHDKLCCFPGGLLPNDLFWFVMKMTSSYENENFTCKKKRKPRKRPVNGQVFDIHPRSASRDLQTKQAVTPLADEFCLLRGVDRRHAPVVILTKYKFLYEKKKTKIE